MKNIKKFYLPLSLCYCLSISQAHTTDILNGWNDPQEKLQPSSQSSKWVDWNNQIEDEVITHTKLNEKEKQASYLDISSVNESHLLRFSYASKNYLNYNESSPLKHFIDEVKNLYNSKKLKEVSIDLSNHFFSTIELEEIYSDLQQEKIIISSLDLSKTGVDSNVTQILKGLLEQEYFKYLNISKTPASEVKETFENLSSQQKNKIIFIAPEYLEIAKKANFDLEVIENHRNYYKNSLQIY